MTTMVFDIETNGLLDELDKIHCISIKILEGFDSGSVYRYRNNKKQHTITKGLEFLATADVGNSKSLSGMEIRRRDV